MPKTAVILTIGNEILSGDVHDENSNWIAKKLFLLGVDLKFIFVLPDDLEIISNYISKYRSEHNYLFTIGGLGPTPDDVTKEAIADSFDQELIENETIVGMIDQYYEGNASEEKFKLAMFPENGEIIYTSNRKWAIGIRMENVFSFPGTPKLLKDSFPTIERYIQGDPIYKTKININCEETMFAEIMDELSKKYPKVEIGSYPDEENFRDVRIVFKSRNMMQIQDCRQEFVSSLVEIFPDLIIS